jgi:hypothetical protein
VSISVTGNVTTSLTIPITWGEATAMLVLMQQGIPKFLGFDSVPTVESHGSTIDVA